MGFFDFFRKKKNDDQLQSMVDDMLLKIFPGGRKEIFEKSGIVQKSLKKNYEQVDIAKLIAYMTTLLLVSKDKSADRIVFKGAMCKTKNVFTEEDALSIYKFVVRQHCIKAFGIDNDTVFNEFYKSLGNFEGGALTDVIPNSYGEYGLCATNPVPVKGIAANEIYLQSLQLLSGEKFTWSRIGSTGSENIKDPIDMYQITTSSGVDVCVIYISPYQSVISRKAPKGFYIK